MRLINTATLAFKEFFDLQCPPYAILSHTWGSEEVSYLDFLFLTSTLPSNALGVVQSILRNPSRESEGFHKVQACCQVARRRGFEWVWIDSCCIDKSSSAELSEAINSMWRWYHNAAECYAYLSDVAIDRSQPRTPPQVVDALKASRWFTRGWTLQELLAPRRVIFYNRRWELLAEKQEIANELSIVTRIPLGYLSRLYDASDGKVCSVAMKMSWLSRRQTTRIEDMAYCMLGLFDGRFDLLHPVWTGSDSIPLEVHMPLIYGEGRKAFIRLQLEILRKTDDDSIYAWCEDKDTSGLLATWPTAFVDSGSLTQINFPEEQTPWLPPSMTSIGLEMRGRYQRHDPAQQAVDTHHRVRSISLGLAAGDREAMVMHCGQPQPGHGPVTQYWKRNDSGTAVVIFLRRFGATWQRVNCRKLDFVSYGMYETPGMDAYKLYYIPQEGT